MLIDLTNLVKKYNLQIKGILHVGAHECEEQSKYIENGVSNDYIYWIEAMKDKITFMKSKDPTLHIYEGVIFDVDGQKTKFHVTNNGQSSSLLQFGTHKIHHPHVYVNDMIEVETTRLDTLIEKEHIDMNHVNFLNLDIQGVELNALKSLGSYINNIEYVYTEVNTEDVYKNCSKMDEIDNFLGGHGFTRVETSVYKQFGWGDAFYMKTAR